MDEANETDTSRREEYLVYIEVHWPPDGDEELKASLIAAEGARARELIAEGILCRLWRVPGRWANWGVWKAASAGELHRALSSLPFFPWLDVRVHPLAAHPSDPGLGA